MSIIKGIDRAFKIQKERGWNEIYYYFDIHDTILQADYSNEQPLVFFKHAKEVLQYFSKREDIIIGLFTCSYPKEIIKYIDFFNKNEINFKFSNKNLDIKNTTYGYYEDKPYYNVLFEDKAGFDAETDWLLIKKYFKI